MSIDARLNKLMPSLTAKERASLVLRSLREKTPEDPLWRRTMPSSQGQEFNRLIVLMNACNIYLPLYITMVEQHTEQLYLRFMWLDTLIDSGCQVWRLAQLIPASKRRQAEQAVAKSYPVAAALGPGGTRALLAQCCRADGERHLPATRLVVGGATRH